MPYPHPPTINLHVASYNVHGFVGTDGRYDPDRVGQVIRQMRADIVGLQEVDDGYWSKRGVDQVAHLARSTGLHGVSAPTLENRGGRYGNALLTRWPVTAVRRYDLSVGRFQPRGALDVELEIARRRVRVVVTHFGLRSKERRLQAATLAGFLRAHEADTVIVAGDFNEWLWVGRALHTLDAHLGKPALVATYPSRMPILPLDRIWVYPTEQMTRVHAYRSAIARIASDHLPVVANVSLS